MRNFKLPLALLLVTAIFMPPNQSLAGGWHERRHNIHQRHDAERVHHRNERWREHRRVHRHSHRRDRHEYRRGRDDHHSRDNVAAVLVTGAVVGGIVAILTLGHGKHHRK